VASALLNSTQQVGGSLGTALLNTIFTTAVASFVAANGTSPVAQAHGAIHGYNVAFTASAVLFGIAGLLTVLFIRKPAEMVDEHGNAISAEEREALPAGV